MIEQKRQAKEQERMKSLENRLRIEQEAQEARQRQREIDERERIKRLEMKMDLDMQLRLTQDRKRKEKEDLYNIDRKDNRDVLKVLEEDPTLMNKVLDRVQQTKAVAKKATSIF